MGTVNKGNIIREIATKSRVPEVVVKDILEQFLDGITARAEAGDTISLIGFGKFQVKARPARPGRNPATGVPMEIPESRKLTFKPSPKKVA
ncbi:integration host factor subunit alpha [Cypionkella aquatica]|uniref:Integration host factor subunit alpha n=1 Tax=Cypionkella aquatica TaxID=1756042 RepID=A0AA37X0F8_9RHOB|nr:HU family DNA-binding protein [Cypionkella aquatica]GLS86659.1 integration host factor subunit alpha [Cypionkella aquatica]